MFKINNELAQSILDYLVTKPYHEVFQLIEQFKRLDKITEENKSNE